MWHQSLQLKGYFKKRFNNIAFLSITSFIMCDISYATDKTLQGGGTSSWIVQCTAWLCGTQSASDKLTISNGDNSGNFTFTSINFQTATIGGDRKLEINTSPVSGKITIDRLFTSYAGTTGFNASLSVNANTHIKSLEYINSATPLKGTTINVSVGATNNNNTTTYTKDLVVDKISFNNNGLAGTNGTINLMAKDITIGIAAGRLSQNLNVNADGSIKVNQVYFDGISGVVGFAVIPRSTIVFDAKGGSFTSGSVTGMGHSNIYIKAKDKVMIDNLTFAVDICITEPCAGYIQLQSTDSGVIVKNLSGGTTNESGIGSFNKLKVIGNNFYAGKLEAISLTTSLNNSYLDLSEVKGTTFIDDLYFRNGTLNAQNFDFNNLNIYKANANRVTSPHPSSGSAYTQVSTNIDTSFINYLSMEIGTSNTADSAALWFKGGGTTLNLNLIDARATSYINFGDISNVNVNILNATETDIYLNNGIFNTITSKKGQTAITNNASTITANALNINELLHIKDGSKHSGVMNIVLNSKNDVNQDFSKYLNVGVDSNTLKSMNKDDLQKLISSKTNNANNYKNASGTYITTSDGKHYLLLPDIMTNENITNNNIQATNGGNLLVEQTALTKGALNNYGKILLDAGFVSGDKPKLSITGNLNNYNEIIIGANGNINITGDFDNKGVLNFRIQSNPTDDETANQDKKHEVKNGSMTINGKTTIDISPGISGAFKADILDYKTLANLGSNIGKQYTLITAKHIDYIYTQGNYTTTFSKDDSNKTSIKTEHAIGGNCKNSNCQTGSNGNTQQETDFTINGKNNPWDMDKAQTDSSGNKIENSVGQHDNHGNLILKPSQSDKKEDCKDKGKYCGFGNNSNGTEADRGYDYAQDRMKNSFALTYKGGSIDGKYIKVEKIVNDTTIGFKINKVDINNFMGSNAETPLCTKESSTFDCALYMEAGGNNSWINAIKKESVNSYDILKNLFYNDDSSLIFLINLDQTLAASRNINYFLEVGRTLDTAFKHVANLETKAQTIHTLSLAMDSARINRLAKIASIHGSASEWIVMQNYEKNLELALKEAEKLRFASIAKDSVNEAWFDTLADLVMRFNQREEYPNHAWINMLGNFSFQDTGTAQLYGFNAGYDYFVDSLQSAFGLYVGYGYGTFNGNNNGFTANNSNNIFTGIYTRTFIENHEIDVTLNSVTGLVNERQNSLINNFDLLNLFSDSYTYTLSNLEFNTTYGYAFLLKQGYIVKPYAGLSYYLLHSSPFTHTKKDTIFSLNTIDNTRQTISINIGIDGRKYFANQSYVFLLGQLKQDLIILQNNLNQQGYVSTQIGDSITNFNMNYKTQGYMSYVFLTGGGEYSFGRWYLNGSLSMQSSVFEKNFGFGFNLGGRVVF